MIFNNNKKNKIKLIKNHIIIIINQNPVTIIIIKVHSQFQIIILIQKIKIYKIKIK